MRVAYVTETYPPEINGVALTAARCVRHLRAAGHAVQLIRPRQPGEAERRDEEEWRCAGAPLPRYPALRFGWARVAALRQLWAETGGPPDLVHVVTPGPLGWAALRAARAQGLAATADFRTNFHAYCGHYGLGWLEPVVLAGLRRLHGLAEMNFVPTPALRDALQARGFDRLQVLGRGVDGEAFAPAHRCLQLRRAWGAGPQTRVLLHVGRLAAEKNVGTALRAFEQLRAEGDTALRMVVVGEGPQRAALQAAHPQALFVGARTGAELARHYASADVFLFPSLTETFGNVSLEALASGLSLAAFDSGAAGHHARDGHSACLAPPSGGDEAFLSAARRALQAATPGSPLRQQAREAAAPLHWDRVLRRFERHLLQVAQARRDLVPHAAMA